MADTFVATIALVAVSCGKCDAVFGMESQFYDRRRDDHETCYCPNGHPRCFTSKSEAEELRDQLAREKHHREQAQALAEHRRKRIEEEQQSARRITRRLNATRGVVTRQKNRIAKGKCPCCSKTFKDVAHHMKTQHPNWNPEREAEVRSNG